MWMRAARVKRAGAKHSSRYPADVEKGAMQRDLGERFGHPRKAVNSREPTATAAAHGASDVGQDDSSGSELLDADPTRFSASGTSHAGPHSGDRTATSTPRGTDNDPSNTDVSRG